MTVSAAAAAPTHAIGGSVGGVPPYIQTACTNARCPAYQVRRQVWLKQAAVGVVALPNLVCATCRHQLPYSIHGSLDSEMEEGPMPKIHNGRGPTDKNDIPAPAPETAKFQVVVDMRGTEELDSFVRNAVAGLVDGDPLAAVLGGEPVADTEPGDVVAEAVPAEATTEPVDAEPAAEDPATGLSAAADATPPADTTSASAEPEVLTEPKSAPRKTAGRKVRRDS